ncbi:hypothetical protein GQ54DRAFT_300489 [Martensiomyces pterosporus]|nr:hypothetical protein GQ54DRAFT_300489 [Martensiomyces pterosporus]
MWMFAKLRNIQGKGKLREVFMYSSAQALQSNLPAIALRPQPQQKSSQCPVDRHSSDRLALLALLLPPEPRCVQGKPEAVLGGPLLLAAAPADALRLWVCAATTSTVPAATESAAARARGCCYPVQVPLPLTTNTPALCAKPLSRLL